MRFAILVKANADSEAGILASKQHMTAMHAYNEELVRAGIMAAAEGLQASSKGARVIFSGHDDDGMSSSTGVGVSTSTVVQGPFDQDAPEHLVAGFWVLKSLRSLEEAVGWARKCPGFGKGAVLEVRRVFEAEDVDDGSVEAEELRAREAELREKAAAN